MVLGLGTGSTMRFVLEHVAARRAQGEWADLRAIPTSRATEQLARHLEIPLCDLAAGAAPDLTIDGADEVDPDLRLIKGLGGALLREKIVASVSRQMIVVADATKRVERLGSRVPLPVEVDPFGAEAQRPFLAGLGSTPELREIEAGVPFVSDGGHWLFDCHFAEGISEPGPLEAELNARPGVLCTGLFLGFASAVVFGTADGTQVVRASRHPDP
jgi:ribose 5-phosphate isomerase A